MLSKQLQASTPPSFVRTLLFARVSTDLGCASRNRRT